MAVKTRALMLLYRSDLFPLSTSLVSIAEHLPQWSVGPLVGQLVGPLVGQLVSWLVTYFDIFNLLRSVGLRGPTIKVTRVSDVVKGGGFI